MSLKDLVVPKAQIEAAGVTFHVRGLSLEDILLLVSEHKAELSVLFDRFQDSADTDIDDTRTMGANLIQEAPGLAAKIIAIAADEPDAVDNVRQLPFPAQVDTLDQIGRLTFESQRDVKKVLEIVIRVAQGANSLMDDLQT